MKPKSPLVFRLEAGLHERLEECSKRIKLKKYQLAILAMEAAVEAIEQNDFSLVLPIKFKVTEISSPAPAERDMDELASQVTRREAARMLSSGEAAAASGRTSETTQAGGSAALNEPVTSPTQAPSTQTEVSYRASARKRTRRGRKSK